MRPRRSLRTLAAVALCTVLVACGGNDGGNGGGSGGWGSGDRDDDPATKPTPAEAFAEYVDDLDEIDLAAVALPDPIDRFSAEAVAALAAIARDLALRSIDPALAELDPLDAVDQVIAGQIPEAINSFWSYMNGATAGLPWHWNAVSLLTDQVGEPRIVKAAWDAQVYDGTDVNGDPLNHLSVYLQVLVVHEIEGADHPIVVERTIVVDSYQPLEMHNGWWPGITILTYPFGNDGCELFESQQLVPSDSDRVLRTDLADLKSAYRASGVSNVTWPEPDAYEEAAASCEDG